MRYIHNIKISVFVKPEEYKDNIAVIPQLKNKLYEMLPIDFDKQKVSIKEESAESFENRQIKIITLEISKEAHTNMFIKKIKELLGVEQCKKVLEQKWSRLDEELYFYIRIDKEEALKDKYLITDSGNCIHIKMNIAAFPKNRENALKIIEQIFS
jgi:RNA-binding protein